MENYKWSQSLKKNNFLPYNCLISFAVLLTTMEGNRQKYTQHQDINHDKKKNQMKLNLTAELAASGKLDCSNET